MEIVRSSRSRRAGSRGESEHADAPTRERVAAAILESGPSTAAVLAERLRLTPAAVRRHLDHMVEDGTVEPREARVYGARGRGRPAKVFALTDLGRDRFDQQYDDLAVQALRFLAETGGDDAVMAFARRRVADLEHAYERIATTRPALRPSEALAAAMSEAGYAASVRSSPIGEQLCQQHCPVSHVAHEFPQLCEAETELIGKVLGSHVQRLATIAHGDGVCTTCIPAPPRPTPSTAAGPVTGPASGPANAPAADRAGARMDPGPTPSLTPSLNTAHLTSATERKSR